MTNLLDLKKKWDYTSEEELTQIYQEQYNDVFSKILLLNSNQFMNVLEKQIITYLLIIKKQPIMSLLSRVTEYFIQKYYEDREKVNQAFQSIKQTNVNELEYLDKLNCFLHCPHSSGALHTCGNRFVLYNDFIFCMQCKKVYNEEQAKMFCDFCGVEYYTKLREISNEDLENFFPVCYENPHCLIEKEEKIKCKNCKEDLYVDISKFNNLNKYDEKNRKIENLFCNRCKINYKVKDLDIKCKKCNKKYFSDVKIFNEFNNLKTDYLCIVHTLLKRKYALPKNTKKRLCKCELLTFKKYKHNSDRGILLEGLRQGKKVIICDRCFKIFNYYNFNWSCPECGCGFNGNNNTLLSKELSESSSVSYKIEQDKPNSKYNTTASNTKVKNIYPNNKQDIKNGKIYINNNEKNNNNSNINNNINDSNNSKPLRNSQKMKENFSDRHTGIYNTNLNNNNSNNNNNNSNINSNRNILRGDKRHINRVNINEDNPINPNDKNNQTCNSLINSINSSIKLKNNFNEKNYNNNNKALINNINGNNSNNNNINTKEKNEFSSRYNNINNNNNNSVININKDMNNLKNNKEKIISNDNNKNENKSKRNYNNTNNNEPKNFINSIANSKNKKKSAKNEEMSENSSNNTGTNKNSIILNKMRKNTNRDNNVIKINLENKENTTLTPAKSSINIHSINNNLVNNPIKSNNSNYNKQILRGKNEQNNNMKQPKKLANNGIKKQPENTKQDIKRNYSSDKNKKEDNIDNTSNNINNKKNNISNRNKKNPIDENSNNITNNKSIKNNDNNIYSSIYENVYNEDNKNLNNLSIIKKNQSVNMGLVKNNNNNNNSSSSKNKINKIKINDNANTQNVNEENDRFKNAGDKLIKRSRGSPNHKRVDIVQSNNNNNSMNKNNIETVKNINVKVSYDLSANNNNLNRSQNGKDLKDNKNIEKQSNPVNRSINIVSNISEQYKNNINQKNKINNNIPNKNSNNNSIGVIQQEENEDENSIDYNVNKSKNYSSNKNDKESSHNKNSNNHSKNKLVENRYNNFNENIQITNENNIYINDREEKQKGDNIPTKPIINSIYVKNNNNNNNDTNNLLYKNTNNNNVNISSINNLPINNESSKNISSEGYQFNCDNYNVVQLLGEGTFGKIYLVEDPTTLQKYALKKITVSDMEELAENKKEFELLMKLSQDNPNLNVVKIFGIQVKKLDKFNLVMYVLMEAAQCDWECEIRNRNQYQAFYTEEELMKILRNLVTTLACLQKQGICHRDVKPQNILCFGKDNYKLSDFGEAKKKKKRKINGNMIYDFEGDTSKQTVRGTELYMSPILFQALHDCPEIDLEYNAYKSDVFSLGLCMLLSSTLGFQALYDIRELYDNNKVKRIIESNLNSRYSKEYIKLIVSMLQIKEKNRPDFIELETLIQNNQSNK